MFSKHASSSANVHFIHRLGPEVVKLVEERGREGQLEVVLEATQVLELLLEATPESKSRGWGGHTYSPKSLSASQLHCPFSATSVLIGFSVLILHTRHSTALLLCVGV